MSLPALTETELIKLLDVMRLMQAQILDGNWQELNRLDSERRALLKYDSNVASNLNTERNVLYTDYLDQSNALTDSQAHYKKLCHSVLELDNQILEALQSKRADMLKQNRELSAQVSARNIYKQTSSMQ